MDGIGTSIKLTRGADGRIIYQVRDAKCAKLGDAAYVKGNADFQMGSSQGSDTTQFMFRGLDMDDESEIILQNTDNLHYNIEGNDVYVTSEGGNANRTVQMNTTNSTLDLSNAGGSQYVLMESVATNNETYLGYGNDNYIDKGSFNYVKDQGGSNRFETTEDSRGAVIVAGAGADKIELFGDYGIVDAGDGANEIYTGLWGRDNNNAGDFDDGGIANTADNTAGYRNIVISGSGDDTINDAGGFNLFFDTAGKNVFTSEGTNAIALIGTDGDGEGIYNASSDRSFIFNSETLTSEMTGTTYNLYTQMSRYRWDSLYNYLVAYSTISSEDLRSIYNQEVLDSETLGKLEDLFGPNLGNLEEAIAEDKKLHPQKYGLTEDEATTEDTE